MPTISLSSGMFNSSACLGMNQTWFLDYRAIGLAWARNFGIFVWKLEWKRKYGSLRIKIDPMNLIWTHPSLCNVSNSVPSETSTSHSTKFVCASRVSEWVSECPTVHVSIDKRRCQSNSKMASHSHIKSSDFDIMIICKLARCLLVSHWIRTGVITFIYCIWTLTGSFCMFLASDIKMSRPNCCKYLDSDWWCNKAYLRVQTN